MTRLGMKLGAKRETFMGLSGIGDLMVTCFSGFSRNRNLGEWIGKGFTLKDSLEKVKMTSEGVFTCKALKKIDKIAQVEMPISREVYQVLFRRKKPRNALKELLGRSLKEEFYS
ncbi:MAG TPA: NAD(P)H-dependent glycerol-3-phosphate dehydrogenase, partial [bacterium]|nr:NAD(P)H-dependent glycerol-3-phosphate dehydrogenase [bacterium]